MLRMMRILDMGMAAAVAILEVVEVLINLVEEALHFSGEFLKVIRCWAMPVCRIQTVDQW